MHREDFDGDTYYIYEKFKSAAEAIEKQPTKTDHELQLLADYYNEAVELRIEAQNRNPLELPDHDKKIHWQAMTDIYDKAIAAMMQVKEKDDDYWHYLARYHSEQCFTICRKYDASIDKLQKSLKNTPKKQNNLFLDITSICRQLEKLEKERRQIRIKIYTQIIHALKQRKDKHEYFLRALVSYYSQRSQLQLEETLDDFRLSKENMCAIQSPFCYMEDLKSDFLREFDQTHSAIKNTLAALNKRNENLHFSGVPSCGRYEYSEKVLDANKTRMKAQCNTNDNYENPAKRRKPN